MTDNDIIKALECCDSGCCKGCPVRYDNYCMHNCRRNAIDLINRQKADIYELRKAKVVYETVDYCSGDLEEALEEIAALRKSHDELIAKNREQEEEIEHLKCVTIVGEVREIPLKFEKLACISWEHPIVEAVKSEVIKEFAEAVKIEFYREFDELIPSIMADRIDNLVKEMVGDSE